MWADSSGSGRLVAGLQRQREARDHGGAAGGDPLVQQPRRALLRHQHEPPGVRVRPDRLEVGA